MLLSGGGGTRSWDATGAEATSGDEVALHFSVASPTGQQHFRTRAKIARLLDGGNGLGVSFEEGLDQKAFKALLDFAVAAGTAVPDELPEPEPETEEQAPPSSPGSTSATNTTADKSANVGGVVDLRDPRISEDAASKLRCRIVAVVNRSSSRIITSLTKAVAQDFLVKARDDS